MDWLLGRIQMIRMSMDPIIWAPADTEIEHLTLALEDRHFFRHSGIDWRFVPRVCRQIVTFKRVGGVSTIEQQLIRTILERRNRTLRRKSREMLLSWVLSYRMAKRDILRTYLSTAYFGYGIRGCDEAAELLFSLKSPELNMQQAALLASLLVYPLPRVVREHAEQNSLHPMLDHETYLRAASSVAPKWALRMRRRMAYGLAQRRKAK